jgi:short-subunit dehydrogenase
LAYEGKKKKCKALHYTLHLLYSFLKSIWYEFKPIGVGVTVATPGAVDTVLGLAGLQGNEAP